MQEEAGVEDGWMCIYVCVTIANPHKDAQHHGARTSALKAESVAEPLPPC